ncbi:MAG: pyridoxamine 5'-phosphate oxidase family protein [Anaerovoracaceae bacterium]|jgi:nitroimidazol reductase NimA-like FMN-containing flavoprotein (pyridoxamine 5'-phosphate oxidase superfamily)
MFRKMRRWKQQLTEEECVEILKSEPRGVLSVHGEDGYPYGVPMNFIYYDNGKIYFHGAKTGHKIDALRADARVSFTVFDHGYLSDEKPGLNVKSVILFGKIAFVDDPALTEATARKLGLKYDPKDFVEAEIQRTRNTLQMLELNIDHMTGKLVNEY